MVNSLFFNSVSGSTPASVRNKSALKKSNPTISPLTNEFVWTSLIRNGEALFKLSECTFYLVYLLSKSQLFYNTSSIFLFWSYENSHSLFLIACNISKKKRCIICLQNSVVEIFDAFHFSLNSTEKPNKHNRYIPHSMSHLNTLTYSIDILILIWYLECFSCGFLF